MIGPPAGVRVLLAAGITDMRKGFDGLAAMAQSLLHKNPFSGAVFAFRGKRGDLIKLLWWDSQGMVLHAKRLERGCFTWPTTAIGVAVLTPAQLSMLLEGVDWRAETKRRAGVCLVDESSSLAVLLCGAPPERRSSERQARAGPLLQALRAWLEVTLPKLSRKSDLAIAALRPLETARARPLSRQWPARDRQQCCRARAARRRSRP
ncbi:transposase [Novosphingobium chloroacetimidivorans]|uniref:Transposase n=1 Tax=Novosphingobium chloroacetimidivorans TaxID=1428314 RepID=A0A7W7NY50_9SPHN|nr:transposase [Novosphingobium chloroacetimidivorans]